MTPQDALNNLTVAAIQFKGTKADHDALTLSVEILARYLKFGPDLEESK